MAKGIYIGINNTAKQIKSVYIGIDNIARKIKKAYIGIGGVARPCFGNDKVVYYGTIQDSSSNRAGPGGGAYFNNKAIFGGNWTAIIDAYDDSLVKSSIGSLNNIQRAGLVAQSNDNYILFAGGNFTNTVDAFNTSNTYINTLTLSTEKSNIGSATINNYIILGGGQNASYTAQSTVDVFDNSLSKIAISNFTNARVCLAAASTAKYVFFGGGSSESQDIEVYDKNLTKISGTESLKEKKSQLAATNIEDYVFFAGGWNASESAVVSTVEVYDNLLTKQYLASLSMAKLYPRGENIGNFAIFAGGCTTAFSSGIRASVDVYDNSLTKIDESTKITRHTMMSASTKKTAFFVGGAGTNGDYTPTVYVFVSQ